MASRRRVSSASASVLFNVDINKKPLPRREKRFELPLPFRAPLLASGRMLPHASCRSRSNTRRIDWRRGSCSASGYGRGPRTVKNRANDIRSAFRASFGDGTNDRAADDDRVTVVAKHQVMLAPGDPESDRDGMFQPAANLVEPRDQLRIQVITRPRHTGRGDVVHEAVARPIDGSDARVGGSGRE